MLDRKVKDIDASIELLEDRAKNSKLSWLVFFITGWIVAGSGLFLVPVKWNATVIGFGICLLIFATWFLLLACYSNILIKIEKKLGELK